LFSGICETKVPENFTAVCRGLSDGVELFLLETEKLLNRGSARTFPSRGSSFGREINSIQLFNDGGRWWIVSISSQQETASHPIS
jgi:hypothetical protein